MSTEINLPKWASTLVVSLIISASTTLVVLYSEKQVAANHIAANQAKLTDHESRLRSIEADRYTPADADRAKHALDERITSIEAKQDQMYTLLVSILTELREK